MNKYLRLMRFDKPIGTLLLLWPTLIALWLSTNGSPELNNILIFVCAVIIMRAAGCVINDVADRNIDKFVTRTKSRPLASGEISLNTALVLIVFLLSLAGALAWQLNFMAQVMCIVALALAIIYPFAKRYTYFPQFVLGLAFGWSIPVVYAQTKGLINLETWILLFSTVCWVMAYDTQYALVDAEDDRKIGIKSTAIKFGRYYREVIFALNVASCSGFFLIGIYKNLSWIYFLGLFCALNLIIYQQYLIFHQNIEKCMRAFISNNYFGLFIFFSLAIALYK